jgi:hypothetical protein
MIHTLVNTIGLQNILILVIGSIAVFMGCIYLERKG